ncbi:MAG: hypothetical protein WCP86_08515, partial [bacterium]
IQGSRSAEKAKENFRGYSGLQAMGETGRGYGKIAARSKVTMRLRARGMKGVRGKRGNRAKRQLADRTR